MMFVSNEVLVDLEERDLVAEGIAYSGSYI
jgi:hypothetical protein